MHGGTYRELRYSPQRSSCTGLILPTSDHAPATSQIPVSPSSGCPQPSRRLVRRGQHAPTTCTHASPLPLPPLPPPPPLPPSLPLPLPRIPTSPSSISFERYVLPACVGAHSGKELVLLSLSLSCRRAVLRLSSGRPRAELRLSSGCSRVAFGRSSCKLCAVFELSSSCRRCYHPHVIALLSRCHRAAVERPLFCRHHAATAANDDDDDHEDRDVLDDREILLCTWQQATHETAKESEWSRIVHSRWVPACFSPITQQPDDRAVP